MNLQTVIRKDLWNEIESAYSSSKYTYAILDAMHYLTNIIREKSGIDGDGEPLIGQAFGGNHPKLRINKFQTQSEQDEQKGFTQILIGLYKGIRNPRSHEATEDTQMSADAIIVFINYILHVLDKSIEPFSLPAFMDKVFDDDFVKSNRFSELLVDEIPENKRFDILIEILRNKLKGDCRNLSFIIKTLIDKLSVQQVTDFLSIVSEELMSTKNDQDIIHIICMLPNELWPHLDETAQLRIENKIYKSIEIGEYDAIEDITKGYLGAWAGRIIKYFQDKSRFGFLVINKLQGDFGEIWYVAKYLLLHLPEICVYTYLKDTSIDLLCKEISTGTPTIDNELKKQIGNLPDEWKESFIDRLEGMEGVNLAYINELKEQAYPPF